MKRLLFTLAMIAAVSLSAGSVLAQNDGEAISLDSVSGLYSGDSVIAGEDVTFWLRFTNPFEKLGISNGFRIYSPDGATWDTTIGDSFTYDGTVLLSREDFAFGYNINHYSTDGSSPDTIGFFAQGLGFTDGLMPVGFDSVPVSITAVFNGDKSAAGKHLCIDSITFFPPGGTWKWALSASTKFPTWDGTHCYFIYDSTAVGEEYNLQIAPDSLMYTAVEGGADPAAQDFNVTEEGGAAINFDAAASPTATWLGLDPTSGTTPLPVSVQPSISGLTPQIYVDSVQFTSADAQNSPQWRKVILEITAAPKSLVVSPDSLMFTAEEGGSDPDPQSLSVSEAGGAAIAFTAAASPNGTWINVGAVPGPTPADVSIQPDISGLTADIYVDSVQIASAEADNSPIWRKVILEVTAAPMALVVSPDSLVFTAEEGGANPDPQNLSVSEAGGAAIAFTAEASPTGTWINVGAVPGPTPADVSIQPDISGLTADIYVDSVRIASTEADNSPVWRKVILEITAAPMTLVVSPDSLVFIAQEGGSDPAAQDFAVSEEGGAAIGFTAAASASGTWIGLGTTSGETPATVSVQPDISGLTADIYVDSVQFASDDADNSPVWRKVILEITSEPISLIASSVDSLEFTVSEGDLLPVTASLNITGTTDGEPANLALSIIVDTSSTAFLSVVADDDAITPEDLTVTVDPTAVGPAGEVRGLFMVFADDADNSLQIPVNITVTPCPELQLSLNSVDMVVTVGSTVEIVDTSVSVTSSGSPDEEIAWESDFDETYFTLSDATGTTPSDVDISYTREFLTVGEFTDSVVFFDPTDELSDCNSQQVFRVTVNVLAPPSEDTIWIATAPARPGESVSIPVTVYNSCPLQGVDVLLEWANEDIYLDSVSLADSRFGTDADLVADIDNDLKTVSISVGTASGLADVAVGKGNLVNLHFTVLPESATGSFAIDLGTPGGEGSAVVFHRNCGGGIVDEVPVFDTPGFINVDFSENFVCGYVVVGPDGVTPIEGATVELWADFPSADSTADPEMTTTTTGYGSFFFDGFTLGQFDLWAYADGYYPGLVEDVTSSTRFIKIVLNPLPPVVSSPLDMVGYLCVDGINTWRGNPLPVGSVIEAMDTEGNICGRAGVVEPGRGQILIVHRDSPVTPDDDEGMVAGETVTFLINGDPAIASGDDVYPEVGEYGPPPDDYVELCLSAGELRTINCPLLDGWNLVSINVQTETTDILDVLGDYMDDFDAVLGYEQGGLVYDPDYPRFSTLWDVDHLSAYWIRVKDGHSVTLDIQGAVVPPSTPIPLTQGWNGISYLETEAMPTEQALQSIDGNLFYAYGWDGTPGVYLPNESSSLTTMDECLGYFVYMTAPDVLIYDQPDVQPVARTTRPDFVNVSVNGVTPTTNWVNVFATNLKLNGATVEAGSMITAHAEDGRRVGSFRVGRSGEFGFMPVYAADGLTQADVALEPGETFYLAVNGVETDQRFEWTSFGDRLEIPELTTKSNTDNNLPDDYSLGQNYPNPFNPTTTISFSLPTAGDARVDVFNILGELIAVPFSGTAEAGLNEVVWDGRNRDGISVSSGVYLYRLTSGNFSETRKMMLLK